MAGKTLTSSLIVRLVDQVSAPARKVGASLLGLNNDARGGFGGRLTQAIDTNNAALERARGRLLEAGAAFYLLKNAIMSPVAAAREFESAMADVTKVVDFPTPQAFKDFQAALVEMSKTVPLSVNGLAQIAAAAGQAGIAGDDLIPFTEAAAKIGVAFDISADQAGDALAKLRTALGLSTPEAVLLSDAMNHLSNAQASSAAEILDVVRRVGAQGTQFGFTAVETAAFASAMISAGAESEVAATSFRNMGLALTRGASATKRQKEAFAELGLDAQKVAKAMQEDAVGTTVAVLEKISQLPREMQSAVSSDLFGNEARALGPLLTQLDLVKDSLALVDQEAKFAGSSFKEFEVRAKTFENATATFNNRLTAMKIAIGNAVIPALNDLMAVIAPVIDAVTKLATEHPELTRAILATASALVAFRIATAALSFVGLMGRGGALAMLAVGFRAVARYGTAAKSAIAMQASLAALSGANYSGFSKLVDGVKAMALAAPGMSGIGGALTAVGAAVAGISAPALAAIGAAVAAVGVAGFFIWKYWDRVSSVFWGVAKRLGEELSPALEAAKPLLEWFGRIGKVISDAWNATAKAVGDFFGSLFGQEKLTDEQKAGYEDMGYQLVDGILTGMKRMWDNIAAWFAQWPQMILDAIGSIDIGSLFKMPDLGAMFGGGEPEKKNWGTLTGPAIDGASGRARGGNMWAGSTYRINEEGEEFFSPKSSVFAHKAGEAPGAMMSSGGVHIGQLIIQEASNAAETARQVKAELRSLLRGAHSDSMARA